MPAVSFPPAPPFSVADRFLSTASRIPGRPALRFPDRAPMSYADLVARMESVRTVLRQRGVGPDTVVAVALDDPAEWVPALLAVLAEGAIYLVLDLRLPEARLRALVEDSTAAWVLCAAGAEPALAALGAAPVPVPGGAGAGGPMVVTPAVPRGEDSVAFLTYTSGSTGTPKGIALRHANLLHEVAVHAATLGLTPDDRLTGLYPPSTVGCTRDLYAALLCGASVGFFPFRDRGLAALRDWMRQERLTRYHSVPPIFRELMQELGPGDLLPDLRTVYLAGDRVTWNDLDLCGRHTAPHCRFYTGIGTSETSSLYAHGFVDPQEPRDGAILPSGLAVPGVTVRLLGAEGLDAAPDTPGEIVVQGRWLAAGYWRRERRAPEPFHEVPGCGGERYHRTGDLATRDARGRLLFQGRRDQQVKILGNRIDLSEVDLHLRRLPGVREVAVRLMAPAAGSPPRLTAFVAWAAGPLPLAEVRRHLLAHLPPSAVPVCFHWLAEFPTLANGKLDAKGLDRIAASESPVAEVPGRADGAPWTPAQERMAGLWREVLGVPECGLHDSFFALGGQSLSAMRLLARIRTAFGQPVTMRLLFDAPTVCGLLDAMGSVGGSPMRGDDPPAPTGGGEALCRVPRCPPPPASHAQERLWFAEALDPGSTAYLMPDAVRLRGPLDAAALERALHRIVERHESLRTVFAESGGSLHQIIQPVPETVLEVEDLTGLCEAERALRIHAAHEQVLSRPFSLTSGPLFRFRLLRLGPGEHRFLRAFHHIIADGWSVEVFHRELASGYAAARAGVADGLPTLDHQFADLAAWQRQRLDGGRMEALVAHWTRQLAEAPPRLEWVREEAGSGGPPVALNVIRPLPAALSESVAHVSRSLGATPFIVVLAAFQALLLRRSGQEDVVVGVPVAGRQRKESEPLIGYFINTVALRARRQGNPAFGDWVRQVRETVLEAQDHQELPFEKLIEALHPDRDARHHPVFQVLFNLLGFEQEGLGLPGLDCTPEPVPPTHPKFDLTLYVILRPGVFSLKARYASDRFRESWVVRLLAQFEALLTALTGDPELPIGRPSLVLPGDAAALPTPGSALEAAAQPAIQAAFDAQALRHPDRLAVRDPARDWTYGELNRLSRRLTAGLKREGLGRGDTLAVAAVPGALLVAALAGILRAGARFLVLDAAQPAGRLRRMMAQAAPARVLLLDGAGDLESWNERLTPELLGSGVIRIPDDLPASPDDGASAGVASVGGRDGAYLVFTSGSTGEPLGILGDHGPVSHFLEWQRTQFALGPGDRFTLLSGLGHDPLLRDVFGPLSVGASLHVPSARVRESAEALQSWFRSEGITVSHLTPAMAQLLTGFAGESGGALDSLRWVFLGGERLTASVVRGLSGRAPRAGVVNVYGTTETPQVMAWHVALHPGRGERESVELCDPIPLGKPIPGVQLLLRNAAGEWAGVGEPGEILIRSPYLSRGYLADGPRTRDRFVQNPGSQDPADRLYRTGDLGYFRPGGEVVFLRREDEQLQVRGYRVEPQEVRAALRALEGVRDAAVTFDSNSGVLHAFLVLHDAQAPLRYGRVRQRLRERLVEAAIPARYWVVPGLPVTPNGKLDLRALIPGEFPELREDGEVRLPRTPLEIRMQALWQEVLGPEPLGVTDDFFHRGGHSLKALRLVTQMSQTLHTPVSLAELLAHPSVAALSEHLERRDRGPLSFASDLRSRGFRGAATGTPWIHLPGLAGLEFLPASLAGVIGGHRPYHDGLQYPGLEGLEAPQRSVAGIAAALLEQVERLHPQGPLWLSGYSMGGLVAHETARQLLARGRRVERVVLFDTRYIQEASRNSLAERWRLLARHLGGRPWPHRMAWALGVVRAKAGDHGRRWLLRRGWIRPGPRDRMMDAGWEAIRTHRPQAYAGAVTLLRATRLGAVDTGRLERDAWNGWRPWTHADFEVRSLDCDHRSVFLEPVSPAVLEAVDSLLVREGGSAGVGARSLGRSADASPVLPGIRSS